MRRRARKRLRRGSASLHRRVDERAITWAGSERDLAAGPGRYELTVTARDTGRLVSATTVVVTVASAAGPAPVPRLPAAPARVRPATASGARTVATAHRPNVAPAVETDAVGAAKAPPAFEDRAAEPVHTVEDPAHLLADRPEAASRLTTAARVDEDRPPAGTSRRAPIRRVRLHNRH